jgi:hypothetical protein
MDRSICSVVIALIPPECSNSISRGTSICTDLQIRSRRLAPNPLEHLALKNGPPPPG